MAERTVIFCHEGKRVLTTRLEEVPRVGEVVSLFYRWGSDIRHSYPWVVASVNHAVHQNWFQSPTGKEPVHVQEILVSLRKPTPHEIGKMKKAGVLGPLDEVRYDEILEG